MRSNMSVVMLVAWLLLALPIGDVTAQESTPAPEDIVLTPYPTPDQSRKQVTVRFELTVHGDVPAGAGFLASLVSDGGANDPPFCGLLDLPPCEGGGRVYRIEHQVSQGGFLDYRIGRTEYDSVPFDLFAKGSRAFERDTIIPLTYTFASTGEATTAVPTTAVPGAPPDVGAGGRAEGGGFPVSALVLGLLLVTSGGAWYASMHRREVSGRR